LSKPEVSVKLLGTSEDSHMLYCAC